MEGLDILEGIMAIQGIIDQDGLPTGEEITAGHRHSRERKILAVSGTDRGRSQESGLLADIIISQSLRWFLR
jgi:hypothetical protein